MKRGFIYSALGLLLAYLLFNSLSFSDEAMAKAFIAKGDEAVKQKKYDQALELYQKAEVEAPEMPEVHFKMGEAHLKLNDLPKGRNALRKCLKLIDAMPKPPEDLIKLRKKAEETLLNADVFRKNYRALQTEYGKELMAFVKKVQPKDNSLAESALRRACWIKKNDEASKMLEDLKKSRLVSLWAPLVNFADMSRWGWTEPSNWTVENEEIICDAQNFALGNCSDNYAKDKYRLSVEFRILKTYSDEYSAGLTFALTRGYKSAVIRGETSMTLMNYPASGNVGMIKAEPIAGILKKEGWNQLILDVAGRDLKAYLNNKLIIEYKSEDSLDGLVGLVGLGGKFSFRDFKYLK